MAEYIELPITADVDALTEIGVDYMENAIPGFAASPGNVETVNLEAASQIGAEVIDQFSLIPPVIFSYLGQSLFGITLQAAVPATATATFTFAADAGPATIPAGTMMTVPSPDGEGALFITDADLAPVPAGTADVGVTALEGGTQANGSEGASELVDALSGIDALAVSAAAGGVEAETDDEYLDRLSSALRLLSPRPILPGDFAQMAQQVPGVGRTLALDTYQPGTNDNAAPLVIEGEPVLVGAGHFDEPRCVSVAITAEDGSAPTQALMHAAWLLIDGAREVNFLAYVIPPKYTPIYVQATVAAYPGYLLSDVEASAEASLTQWLDPQTWGAPPTAAQTGMQEWALNTKARLFEAVDYLNRADGVYYVTDVKLRKDPGDPWSAADIDLTGVAPLPTVGGFEITVVQS